MKYIIFITYLFYLIILNNYSFAQGNNCINYTGGLGDFEHYQGSELINIILKNENHIKRTTGWSFHNPPDRNYEIKFYLDKNEKYSGNASQFISAIKNPGTASNPSFMYSIRYSNLSTETINYYPSSGDIIYGDFKLKIDNLNNVNFVFRIILSNRGEIYRYITSSSSTIGNWQTINFSTSLPEINSTSVLSFYFNFWPVNNNVTTTYKIWIDNFNLYSSRNGRCLEWPERNRISSLKIFDVYGYVYPEDFIHFYLYNDAHLGYYPKIALPIKYRFNNFKYFPYISLWTLHKYRYDFSYFGATSSKWKPKFSGGEFNSYLDFFNDFNINEFNTSTIMKLFPQTRYPELLLLDQNLVNRYKKEFAEDYSYVLTWSNFEAKSIDHHIKSLVKTYKEMYNNSYLTSDAIFFDNHDRSEGRQVSRNYPTFSEVVFSYNYFIKNLYEKISILHKYFGNLGYNIFIEESNDMIKNYISTRDKMNGYLDEGWLLFPREDLRPYSPSSVHKALKTVIENINFDYILIIGAYRYPYCDDLNYNTTTYMIGSFYLVNNPNTYFALRPVGEVNGYNAPQCYSNLFYIDIGEPISVNSIDELVIASTTNYNNGALYRRFYSKGVVYVNTSHNLSFDITLSSTTIPFNRCKIHNDPENWLDFENNIISTSVPPLSSKILYDCQNRF